MAELFQIPVSDTMLHEAGVTAWGMLPTEKIVFLPEIRRICAGNSCHSYGKSWACPPAVGTLEECRDRCLSYTSAFVFSSVYPLEDAFDWEGMTAGHHAFKQVCDTIHPWMKQPVLLFSNEGCIRCKTCTYPDSPCRFPDKLFPSLEGYAILVNALAKEAGIAYNNGPLTVTYFGMACFDPR